MHPIERLRWVARAPDSDVGLMAVDSAEALAAFAHDPAGLVTACRRLIERRPAAGPLWWLASRLLCALDPAAEAYAALDDLERDPTAQLLALDLPDGPVAVVGWPELVSRALPATSEVLVVDPGRGGRRFRYVLAELGVDARVRSPEAAARRAQLVLLEALAVGPDSVVASPGSAALAAAAREALVPVWLVVGVGRSLPPALYDALAAHLDLDPGQPDTLPLDVVDVIAGPAGRTTPAGLAAASPPCPVAPELLRLPR